MAKLPSALAQWIPMGVLGTLLAVPLLVMGAAPATPSTATAAPAKATSIHSRLATCQQSCDANASSAEGRAICKISCMKKEGLKRKTVPVVHKSAAPTPTPGPGAGGPASVAAPPPAPTPAPNAYASCRSECAAGPAASVNTCLLNCESARKHEAQKAGAATQTPTRPSSPGAASSRAPSTSSRPPTPGAGSVTGKATVTSTSSTPAGKSPAQIASCKQSCDTKPGISDTDRATCKLGCESTGTRSSSFSVTGTPAQIRCYKACACESDCAKSQASCERSCNTMSDDGARASCKLQCESSASSCPKRCPAKAQGCTCG